METVPAETHGEPPAANPNSVKSGNSSPRSDGGRSSPPNCAICLGACENSSFTDSCLHQFCFNCLLTWSKVKAECPLCKQNFRSIIHNVRSLNQYEEYLVEQRQSDAAQMINIDNISQAPPRFRYRTTLTLPRRETMAIQQLLELHYPMMGDVLPPASESSSTQLRPALPHSSRHRSPASFRRTVYRHNLWARPLPDFTGRFRDCSPQFYRYNHAQMHRLVPWLNRELTYLLNENPVHISYVLSRILDLLPYYHINSSEFMDSILRFFGDRTEHFLHELYCFASTPYDMSGYDRNVQYTTDPRVSTIVNEVITSSESESTDSDIVLVSSSAPAPAVAAAPPEPAGTSRAADLQALGLEPLPLLTHPAPSVIPIETISHSDTDDDNEVMVVGYIKPPQERTPEIVDLLGSDSDVVLQESGPSGAAGPVSLVKVSLKRHRGLSTSAARPESDDDLFVPRPRSRRRAPSYDSATTVDTCRPTPSPAGDPTWSPERQPSPHYATTSPTYMPSPASSVSAATDRTWSPGIRAAATSPRPATTSHRSRSSTNSEDSEPVAKKRKTKKKSKRHRDASSGKAKAGADKRKTSSKRKQKSRSWREVKSSKKRRDTDEVENGGKDLESAAPAPPSEPAIEQPSTSGVPSRKSESRRKLKKKSSRKRRSASRESRRLRSVVSVPRSREDLNGAENLLSLLNSAVVRANTDNNMHLNSGDSGSVADRPSSGERTPSLAPRSDRSATDSEDDIPLNLTVNRQWTAKE